MNKTYSDFIRQVLKPNFDGKYYYLSREETNEYYEWLTPQERRKNNPPTFKGFAIIPRDTKYHDGKGNCGECYPDGSCRYGT